MRFFHDCSGCLGAQPRHTSGSGCRGAGDLCGFFTISGVADLRKGKE